MRSTETPRLPRYKRAPKPPAMQLTERDEDIIEAVYELRFATPEQIHELFFSAGAASSCRNRLTLLYHNKYLDRRFLPGKAFGSRKTVYCLDKRGAELLKFRSKTGSALHWRSADNDRELYFLEHLVAGNDFRVAISLAARAAGMSISWTDERQLRSRAMKTMVRDPKRLGSLLAVVPDGHFFLSYGQARQGFALELDRANVEEKPFKEKMRALGEWKRTGTYESTFGSSSLRVLFVIAPSDRDPNRLQRIKAWTEAEGGGNLFWFTELPFATSAAVLVESIWQVAGREGKYSLLT